LEGPSEPSVVCCDSTHTGYDCTGQLTNDIYRPATTALNWNGLTVHQWYLLSVDDWHTLAVDEAPTGGAGTLGYDPAGI